MKALVKWCVFALVTGRRARLDLETDRFFTVADEPGLSYDDKLAVYGDLADAYFDTARYDDFWSGLQARLDEVVLGLDRGARFRSIAGPDRPFGVPGARARPVHRPPARADGPVGARGKGLDLHGP